VTAEDFEGFGGFVVGAEKKKDLEVQKPVQVTNTAFSSFSHKDF
jgi:hypothetical protein